MKQLALPPAPEPKLLRGEAYYVGVDLASGPDVAVVERFYRDGRYELYINGKLIPESIYWHREPPFVIFNK